MNTPPTVPQTAELDAPPAWGTVDFISDLHLQADAPATFAAWQHYMESTPADAVFMLGDLFEAWVGDDAVSDDVASTACVGAFEDRCAHVMGQTASRLALFFMHGNRDFLVGQRLMDLCNTALLADPTVLGFHRQRWLLSHGDALCLADTDYMAFRQQVRSAAWQSDFLAKPLTERQALARGLRQQSQAQHDKRQLSGLAYADVDSAAALAQLRAADAHILIHGHTHQPAVHDLGHGFSRVVLSDWDAAATVPRAEVLRLTAGGLRRISLL
ncbi:MAG: UDP-2,3-diacylglucosamine diphosphatase [Hydrogenophaga sp.]|uniref:UDP-2,3-diacylglucosamine diphosphatase n=1 Tax=Polaromonas sp. TaxID=1869339 RepID=UPI00273073F7|nr:UDP-2,3-diacylglucosamine diphosphatase [Polaromonas sp.]MDP1742543.1 UDP-2,3-diacylglucosamine diphosphatase [Polaromonas sp.]MDP1954911.1 UDP-2,3-diacylglucosamine diphosphatase [Polaromonas sp.]MDP3166676.1 UDP-2,3-diacylglucosamine diphosphatase [Hydrogenophaga sp.]MDP3752418.1 UDP-2,3-diacylglucosamine diphosphatase [Polaromonas sp.]